jgi:hypothetical protein
METIACNMKVWSVLCAWVISILHAFAKFWLIAIGRCESAKGSIDF